MTYQKKIINLKHFRRQTAFTTAPPFRFCRLSRSLKSYTRSLRSLKQDGFRTFRKKHKTIRNSQRCHKRRLPFLDTFLTAIQVNHHIIQQRRQRRQRRNNISISRPFQRIESISLRLVIRNTGTFQPYQCPTAGVNFHR